MRSLKSLLIASSAAVLMAGALGAQPAAAGKFRVLYSFTGGSDGRDPQGGLVMDKAGNFYGTAMLAGTCCGVIFKLAPDGTETVLHAFNGDDGAKPTSSLLFDKQGNLYGTTSAGGKGCKRGCGVLFKLAPDGTYTVLHYFKGNKDGHFPGSGLAFDMARKLYGVTPQGGALGDCGTLFRSQRRGGEEVLASFGVGSSYSCFPVGPPAVDLAGNIFVPAPVGGDFNGGVILQIPPGGSPIPVYSFKGGSDGAVPEAGLLRDGAGNLYGTSLGGGACLDCGNVFRIAPDGTETPLYSFQGGRDGRRPMAALAMDDAGNLYGTTELGGHNNGCPSDDGCGTVFKVTPDGAETVLHTFNINNDGGYLFGNLVLDKRGTLYGTASSGGPSGFGTIFALKSQ